MKLKAITLLSLTLACSTVFADPATLPQISIQQALSAAEKAGYTHIKKIEFEHGRWEIEGRDGQGQKFEVNIDATTGALSKDTD